MSPTVTIPPGKIVITDHASMKHLPVYASFGMNPFGYARELVPVVNVSVVAGHVSLDVGKMLDLQRFKDLEVGSHGPVLCPGSIISRDFNWED